MPSTINTAKANNIILEDVLDLTKDIIISGEFSFFGSLVNGGEGFCVFLLDANSSGNVGSPGSGLGFAPTEGLIEYEGNDIFLGTDQSLLGVAFDHVGDFSRPLGGQYTSGTADTRPNSVGLRYGNSGNKNFDYIDTSISLTNFGLDLYETIGYKYPSVTATQTKTPTITPTKTFTNTVNSTLTSTQTNTVTRTNTQSRTNTQTRTPTQTFTPSNTSQACSVVTPTPTRTISPTLSQTKTSTPTNTPTNFAINPVRKAFKVRVTNYGKKVIVYLRNDAFSNFIKVYEYDNLNLEMPLSGKTKVGLSYATGVNTSAFHIYNFSVNGIGYENPFTPTPTATRGLTPTTTLTPTLTNTITVSLTRNHTSTPTQSRTNTRTKTPTQTYTQFATPSKTRTNTATQTRTSTISRTSTQFATRTQTPTQTRTSTQTRSNTPTQTRTPTNTRTQTQTPTPGTSSTARFVAESNSTNMFRFESDWVEADSAAAAVNVLINNGRFGFNKNNSLSNLLNLRSTAPDEFNPGGVINNFNNTYFTSYFFNGPANAAQNENDTAIDGQISWMKIPFIENPSVSSNPNTDYRQGISSNIYQALQILFTTGNTLSGTLIYIDKQDNSYNFAGSNYNIWNIDGLTSDYKIATYDLNTSDLYVPNYDNTGNILYNTDYIEGSITKDNFLKTQDLFRLIPDTRYITVTNNEIDITFSYCSELIFYINPDDNSTHWGARLTLFTNAIQ